MADKPLGPVETGGDLRLSGFHDLDPGEKEEAVRVVTHYERRFKEICDGLDRIKVTLKKIHHTERSDMYELHASVKDKRGHYEANIVGRKLFIALDEVLKKIENEISK
ncbi:MAG: hypothetical protein AABX51_00955 [Nanoarchaeota archaeon]